jgi:hypothetical protein
MRKKTKKRKNRQRIILVSQNTSPFGKIHRKEEGKPKRNS